MSRIPEKERPTTAGLLELHVFYVPEEKWNSKLNKAAVEAIDSFISAGFIRVYPNISLETLRDELGGLLGAEKAIDNFSFLKCVGRSLALVKAKQERELKVKAFVPPFAPHPELYLLPMVENSDSVLSHSLTPDRQSYHTDLHMYSAKSFCVPAVTKKSTKFPQIKHQAPQQPRLTQTMQGLGSFSSSDEKEDLLPSQEPGWDEAHHPLGREQSQSNLEQAALPPHATATCKPTTSVLLTDRDGLIEQIKLVKEERKQLERTRQGLLRKGKDLLAQNRYRRNQARDSWKRKYFDTKKVTEPLESSLKGLRQDLEAFYHKLLHQLQARDGRHKTKRLGKPYAKNELIIQIISESHEIDKLKKKVDDAKMKLVTELKVS
ncbi:hypothetical protein SKAU_G00069930 [Synaphobranchus kaupii]|uniref:Spermatogenesis-associated protein 1 C-terminal domain-containing protein n=1 Tax=Synaphobranchus kaupii TaxID=118154 RepID=A0A9Q1JB67_SYNKA|nr:hypothetical protein SKAU_G00069930 [Synaphobranchus kaupii]